MAFSDLLARRPGGRRTVTVEPEAPEGVAPSVPVALEVDARVLYLANDPQEVKYVSGAFDASRVEFEFSDSFEESRVKVRHASRFTAVVLGWSMPDALAVTLLHKTQLEAPGTPVIVAGERTAQQFRDAGALACVGVGQEFLTQLPRALEAAVQAGVGHEFLAERQQTQANESAAAHPAQAHGAATAHAAEAAPATTARRGGVIAERPSQPDTRVALIGNAVHLLPTSVVAGDDPDFTYVPAKDAEHASSCDVALIDHQDPTLDIWTIVEKLRASDRPPVIVMLVNPNEPVSTERAQQIDDFHVKSAGWIVQLRPRIHLARSRAAVLREVEKVKTREERLRTLVDVLPACVVRLNEAGDLQAVNVAAASLLGVPSPEAVLGKPFETVVSPASTESWQHAFERARRGDGGSLELRINSLAGDERLVETTWAAIPTAAGQDPSFVAVLRDVTSWTHLEVSVEDLSSIPLTVAIESEPVPDPTPEPAPVLASAPIVDLDELRRMEQELLAISAKARHVFETLETELGRADAEHEAAHAERQAAEARLAAAERERWHSFDAFVRSAASGIAYTTTDGLFVSMNASFAAMLGYPSPGECTSEVRTVQDLSGDNALSTAVGLWAASEPAGPVEVVCRRKNGTPGIIRLHGTRVTHGQQADLRLQIVAEDLSDRRLIESQLRRAHRWEHAFKTTAGLAADIRHALQNASEVSTLLLDEDRTSHAAHDHVAALHHATTKALALSRQLLAYGGREARATAPIDLNEIVSASGDLIRRTVDEHVEVALELEASTTNVEADRGAVEELIVNLVHAAVTALPVGGRLTIRTSTIRSGDDQSHPGPSGDRAALTVVASGWGLDRTVLGDGPATSDDHPVDVLAAARRTATRLGATLAVEVSADQAVVHAYLAGATDADAIGGRAS